MAQIFDLNNYEFEPGERVFYDTNVWAAINNLAKFSSDSAPYTAAHKRALTTKCELFTDVLILQEFANVMERAEIATIRKRLALTGNFGPKELKSFRRSPEWPLAAGAVADALRQILRQATILPSTIERSWFEQEVGEYESGQGGFNDRLIARLCMDNDLVLITADGDFAAFDLKILTSLPSLLNQQ